MAYFDFKKIAQQAHIPADKLDVLSRNVRLEFPKDDMMFELHLMRVCLAIQEGRVTLEDAMNPKQAA